MKNILIYLAAVLATAYFAIMYRSTVLVTFLTGEILLLPLLFLLLYLSARKIKVGLRIPIPVAEAGDEIRAEILVENESVFPVTGLDVWVEYRNLFLEEEGILRIRGGADSKGRARLVCSVRSDICGCLEFSIKKIRIYDYLRIFFLPVRQRAAAQAVVLPHFYETRAELSLRTREFAGDGEAYDQNRGGDDVSEVFQLREYRPGDRIQQVHWKLSALSGELAVKEFGRPVNCPVVLFLDFFVEKENPLWMKGFPELAAAVSMALVGAECIHYIVWYEQAEERLFRQMVSGQEDVYRWLQQFFKQRPCKEELDLPALYRAAYPGELYGTELRITLERKVFCQGELCKEFSSERIEEELKQWEVLV